MRISVHRTSIVLFLAVCMSLYVLGSNQTILDQTASDIAPVVEVRRRLQSSPPNKPSIVIHIGPPKTGTTSLQVLFGQLAARGIFEKDGYHYDRKDFFMDTIMNNSCHRKLMDLRQSYKMADNQYIISDLDLASRLRNIPCWRNTLERLQPFLHDGINLFASFEGWSFDRQTLYTENGKSAVDWESVRLSLMPDWNVLVVFAYRRYPEWIFSSFQQMNRPTTQRPRFKIWPNKGGSRISFGSKSTPLDPLPTSKSEMTPINYRYTDDLKQEMERNPDIPYAIFNMHENGGSLSSFVCDILPRALHSCEYALQQEGKREAKSYNPSQSLFYDALAIAAFDAGFIEGSRHNRLDVAKKIREYHEEKLQQSQFDFPLICPTTSQLQGFLELSLLLEEEIVPEFSNAIGVKEEHISDFWKQATNKKFCWIDTEAALGSDKWNDFFRRFRA